MKHSTSRALSAIAAGAAIALLASACGSEGGSGDAEAPPADSGEVMWWGWTPDTPVAEAYIAEFNKEYPDITVTYNNYENVDFRASLGPALDSGMGPDVFNISPAGGSPDTWGPYAIDMAPFAEETLGTDWESQFGGGYVQQLSQSDGTVVALPLGGMSAGFMWYNDDIFQEAGASVPTDYDSWVEACRQIEAIGKQCFAMGAGGTDTFPTEMFHSIANSVAPGFFIDAATGNANWDDPEGVEILQIISNMRDDGIIRSNVLDAGQYPLANEEFMKEEAAMVQMGFWYTQYSGAESCAISMEAAGVSNPECFVQLATEFPDVAGKGNGSEYFGEVDYGLAINADSENIAAAKTFVRWMTMTETGQQNVANALDLLPALQGIAPNWDNITLVNDGTQRPAVENLINASTATSESRQWQTTEATLNAIVIAIQQVLDPSVNMSVEEIAAGLQAASEPSTVGVE